MMERAAAQSVVSAGQVPEDVFWFATQVSSSTILPFLVPPAPRNCHLCSCLEVEDVWLSLSDPEGVSATCMFTF